MTTTAPAVKALTCPSCGGGIEMRAAGHTVSLVCGHCGTTLDATTPKLRVLAAAEQAMRRPAIPLGTRGMLRGAEWEAIGYVERSGGGGDWSEYLLFNPYEGYRFLVDNGTRFSFGGLLDGEPGLTDFVLIEDAYRARVDFVVGEFYWRVRVGEQVEVKEYAREGTLLSRERNDSETSWTALELLDRGEAERAFGIPPRPFSPFRAPLPHEPSPFLPLLWDAAIVAVLAIGVLIAIGYSAPPQVPVFETASVVTLAGRTTTEVVGTIDVPVTSKVTVQAEATLNNAWVDADWSLVDRRTQASYEGYGLAERYYGTDADGPWSEGTGWAVTDFSAVPPGRYDVVVDLGGERWGAPMPGDTRPDDNVVVSLSAWRGGTFGGLPWLAALLILVWPGLLALAEKHHRDTRAAAGI